MKKMEKIDSNSLDRWSFQRKKYTFLRDDLPGNTAIKVTKYLEANRYSVAELLVLKSNKKRYQANSKRMHKSYVLEIEREIRRSFYPSPKNTHTTPNYWNKNSIPIKSERILFGMNQSLRLLGGMDRKDDEKKNEKKKSKIV